MVKIFSDGLLIFSLVKINLNEDIIIVRYIFYDITIEVPI